jgi:hypothetical protein
MLLLYDYFKFLYKDTFGLFLILFALVFLRTWGQLATQGKCLLSMYKWFSRTEEETGNQASGLQSLLFVLYIFFLEHHFHRRKTKWSWELMWIFVFKKKSPRLSVSWIILKVSWQLRLLRYFCNLHWYPREQPGSLCLWYLRLSAQFSIWWNPSANIWQRPLFLLVKYENCPIAPGEFKIQK